MSAHADPDPLGGELFGRDRRWTGALSIASNRASKIELLREAGLDERASRYAVSLAADVEAFLTRYKRCGGCTPAFAKRLREQVPHTMTDQTQTHETGTRRLSLWRSTASGSSHGDQARGDAWEAVYLSDDEAGCAEVSIYVVENMDGGEPCGSYGVEERVTIGAAVFEDDSWRADDSADIIYDWADALTYYTHDDAQAAADRCGTLDLSWALNLRGGLR